MRSGVRVCTTPLWDSRLGSGHFLDLWCDWQADVESRTGALVGSGPQTATVRLDDGTADRQAHAAALGLGGEECVEDLIHLCVAGTCDRSALPGVNAPVTLSNEGTCRVILFSDANFRGESQTDYAGVTFNPRETPMRMSPLFVALAIAGGFAVTAAFAKAPADATGECKDGTYTKAEQREGACSSHGGVKDWFGKERPADATGQCKDGTYTTAAAKSGACSGHKGVKDWYGGDSKAARKPEPRKTTSNAPPDDKPAPAPKKTEARPSTDRVTKTQPYERPTRAEPGGGAGRVWVNTESKVYHCEKDAWYGKTKQGEYMSEAHAKDMGARPSRGKECS